ncbi:hypothetical protein Cni_G11997 [Canna indica]|uniref:Uncharacterized protein n=1 Tax=Canna indica TaxID=4628 RepID=A0AAQ3K707_9LILI|nr:hypothetical protein Cni_G11997 [Canna indica]
MEFIHGIRRNPLTFRQLTQRETSEKRNSSRARGEKYDDGGGALMASSRSLPSLLDKAFRFPLSHIPPACSSGLCLLIALSRGNPTFPRGFSLRFSSDSLGRAVFLKLR